MLNKQSIEIYTLTEDREKRLWQDCIFVFDTSALLEFYLYSDQVKESIFQTIFPKLINRLWIPQQVEYEYLKNRENVIRKPIEKYKNLIEENKEDKDSGYLEKIEESIEKINKEINKEIKTISCQFQALKEKATKQDRYPYLDKSLIDNLDKVKIDCNKSIEGGLNNFKDSIEEFKNEIKKEISNRQNEIQAIYQSDSVLDGFNKYFEVGEGYSFDEIMEIVKEGELRYRSKIPPGYKDQGSKEGISIYGDLILWKQIIAYAKKVKKPIILIINDIKEDWCYKKDKRIEKPREDLIKELYTITGMELWMYTFSDFLYTANKLLITSVDNEVLEEVKEIEKEQLKQKEEDSANRMPSYNDPHHHPQEQDYWQEEIEVENFIGQRQTIRTNLLRVYPERFNTYDAYMDIPMSISPVIQKVISPRLGKIWTVITGPKKSPIMGYFRGDYTDNAPPAWVFGLSLSET
ncbi:PIN-like domain-containing protein [Trichormus sp. NMC-1]|uniref:PIN-like domain-containing protein n=1 Tax=Trichormus sp. NMC-1 TaxID=1853259 RepID=UPI0008DC0596|nr:PIN-like domain-containing protein [Trichormus sp. NMC-1]